MRDKDIYKGLINDIIYDFLVLMKDDSIFGSTDYDKGYIDSLYETYKIIQDKLELFGINDLTVIEKMPLAEEWHKKGSQSVPTLDL